MAYEGPRLVGWTNRALVKAEVLGVTRTDVQRVVLESRARADAQHGAADWLVSEGRLMFAYNHPHG